MARYKQPLTPEQLAALRDSDIDFSDIPELGEEFWEEAMRVAPGDALKDLLKRAMQSKHPESFAAGYMARDAKIKAERADRKDK